jgi:hypothetical protein
MKKALIVNLFAGAGAGKTTLMADVFVKLKRLDLNVEFVPEFAKDLVWLERFRELSVQPYVTGKQLKRLKALENKVEVIVTDSPIVLGMFYNNYETDYFNNMVLEEFNQFNNFNIFVDRKKKYNPKGRMQTEEEARRNDQEIKQLLIDNGITFTEVEGTEVGSEKIVKAILNILGITREG